MINLAVLYSPPQSFQKPKYPSYGSRRKKKVKKSLYGERETASKKPLLSPIPEIPEVSSSVSSPNSPKADELFTGHLGFSFVLLCSLFLYFNSYTKKKKKQPRKKNPQTKLLIAFVIAESGASNK